MSERRSERTARMTMERSILDKNGLRPPRFRREIVAMLIDVDCQVK